MKIAVLGGWREPSPRPGEELPEGARRGPILRLGVSACLLGDEVRFDGGHKRDRFLLHTLGPHVEWRPLCPEVEIGMGTPRESVRLVGDLDAPRMLAPRSGRDWTDEMLAWSRARMEEIASWDLHGYVFKKGSPSCGLFRVKVYNDKNMPNHEGRGLFAAVLTRHFPLLPVEEEGRLHDPPLRENFIDRLFAAERWKRFLAEDPTPRGLVRFHTAHKLTLMAHSPDHYRRLGRLVGDAGTRPWREMIDEYARLFAEGMQKLASRGRQVNVLHHLMGFLKNDLDPDDKAEVLELIEDYRQGLVPVVVPITLIKHHLRIREVPEWVDLQVYLHPYPKEMMLRSYV